jgi:hypothetical protein
MREGVNRVNVLPNDSENFINQSSENEEETFKILRNLYEQLGSLENKEHTVELLHVLSQRIKLLEKRKLANGIDEVSCINKKNCFTSIYQNGECPCELFRI